MATRQFKRGDRKSMNNWLRMRVAAQGLTLVAILTYAFKVRQDRGLTGRVEGRHPEAVMTVQTREDKEKREFEERLANAIKTEKENEELRRAERQHEASTQHWKGVFKEGLLKKNAERKAQAEQEKSP